MTVRKSVLTLIATDEAIKEFLTWLDAEHTKRTDREAKPDTDPEEEKRLMVDIVMEQILEDAGVEGYEFT